MSYKLYLLWSCDHVVGAIIGHTMRSIAEEISSIRRVRYIWISGKRDHLSVIRLPIGELFFAAP